MVRTKCLVTVLMIVFLFSMFPNVNVNEGSAATGKIQFGFNSYVSGNSYLLIFKDLTVSTPFGVTYTTGACTNFNFTTSSSESRVEKRQTLKTPTSGTEVLITLYYFYDVNPGGYYNESTVMDTMRIQATDIEDIINRDTLVEIIMLIMVIMVVLAIVLGIFKKMT